MFPYYYVVMGNIYTNLYTQLKEDCLSGSKFELTRIRLLTVAKL